RRCDSLRSCLVRQGIHVRPEVWKRSNPYYGWMKRLDAAAGELAALVAPGESFLFVDQDECGDRWGGSDLIDGRRSIPFLEREGRYWGPPPDDETAVRELERHRQAGVGVIAFAWPAFWWLEFYSGFHRHLRDGFRCLTQNDRLVIFDLR